MQALNESLDLCKRFIASHMTKNLIDSGKAHLPVQYVQIKNSFARSDAGVVNDSEPHLIRTCKTSLLFAPFDVRVQADCFPFSFYTPTKLLIRLHIKYKTVLFLIL